jgi:hypothetical protein
LTTVYIGTCRARDRFKPCPNQIADHGLWCSTHFKRFKARVVAGETTWEAIEKGRRRARAIGVQGGRDVDSERSNSNSSGATFEGCLPLAPPMPALEVLLATATKDRFFPKTVKNRVIRYPDDAGGSLLWCSCGNATVALEAWCCDGHLVRRMVGS